LHYYTLYSTLYIGQFNAVVTTDTKLDFFFFPHSNFYFGLVINFILLHFCIAKYCNMIYCFISNKYEYRHTFEVNII